MLAAAAARRPTRRCSSARRPCDDAGVYRISDELALVQTVDFFTPIVDDPYDFGRIAAANALSDVYAMGARPVTALNLVAFSLERLGARGAGRDPARRRRDRGARPACAIVGGHSIDDPEPKYGMAVTGVVHPERVVRNSTGAAGRRAVPDQADRRRRGHDGGQARHGARADVGARAAPR